MMETALILVLLLAICPTLGVARLREGPTQQKACSNNHKVERIRQKTTLEEDREEEIVSLRRRFPTRLS